MTEQRKRARLDSANLDFENETLELPILDFADFEVEIGIVAEDEIPKLSPETDTQSSSSTISEDEVTDHDSEAETSSSDSTAEKSPTNTISQCTRSIEFKVGSGETRKAFHIPVILLVRVSDVLKEELNGVTSTITLADISRAAFSEFLFWLYHQDSHEAFGEATKSSYEDPTVDIVTCAVDLCILATKWKLIDLHNQCIEVLSEQDGGGFDAPDQAIRVYNNTEADSPLRLYVTMKIHECNATYWESPASYFLDDIKGYLKYDANEATWSYRCEDYYSELFRLASYNEGEFVGSASIEPVPFEEYLMK